MIYSADCDKAVMDFGLIGTDFYYLCIQPIKLVRNPKSHAFIPGILFRVPYFQHPQHLLSLFWQTSGKFSQNLKLDRNSLEKISLAAVDLTSLCIFLVGVTGDYGLLDIYICKRQAKVRLLFVTFFLKHFLDDLRSLLTYLVTGLRLPISPLVSHSGASPLHYCSRL